MLVKNTPYVQFAAVQRQCYMDLGVTAADVKEYFEVSAYRNVLDMLNTFEGVLNRWGQDLHDQNINLYSFPPGARYLGAANVGYAISKIGQQHGWNEVYVYSAKQLSKNGLRPVLPVASNYTFLTQAFERGFSGSAGTQAHYQAIINKYKTLSGHFNVADLLNLARQINWELNRVRLPVPHNFRQINEKIQGRAYNIVARKGQDGSIAKGNNSNYINLMELISVYGQLKVSINVLRVSTRKEIDAANLARKVQEETLRREQEALITRQKAEAEAEARRLIILSERKAALEKEFQEAEALKAKLAETRAQLAAELQLLEASKQVATPPEIVAIETKQVQVIDAIEKVEIVAIDKDAALETAKQAAINVNNELIEAKNEQVAIADIILTDLEQQKAVSTPIEIAQLEQQQQTIIAETQTFEPIYIPPANVNITLPESKTLAPTTEKSNLVPILLTVAAGVILT